MTSNPGDYVVSYGPNPNQNPLDRVGGGADAPVTRQKDDKGPDKGVAPGVQQQPQQQTVQAAGAQQQQSAQQQQQRNK